MNEGVLGLNMVLVDVTLSGVEGPRDSKPL